MPLDPYSSIIDEIASAADFSDRATRERLSSSAIRASFAIMENWNVSDKDARALLGGIASEDYDALKNKPPRTLDLDTLIRISFLVGIFKALNTIYAEKLAGEWPQLPNTNPTFGGQKPLTYMVKGGLPAMQRVRQLLDATKEGM